MKIDRDKIVRLTFPGKQGFSIQTNGNLPKTHRANKPDVEEVRV